MGTIQQDGRGLLRRDDVRDGRASAYIAWIGGLVTTDIGDLVAVQICGIGRIDIHQMPCDAKFLVGPTLRQRLYTGSHFSMLSSSGATHRKIVLVEGDERPTQRCQMHHWRELDLRAVQVESENPRPDQILRVIGRKDGNGRQTLGTSDGERREEEQQQQR